MIKAECVTCTKSTFCGRDNNNSILFGCKNPFCIKEEITDMTLRNEVIKELKNSNKN